jgi:Tol biopolymer transport system component
MVQSRGRASLYDPETQAMFQKLALLKLAASSPVSPSLLDVDPRALETLRFTPEGKAVAYVIYDQGVDNILVEPLDGSRGKQITSFASARITGFSWAPNGRSLALARTERTSDVILLHDNNSAPK